MVEGEALGMPDSFRVGSGRSPRVSEPGPDQEQETSSVTESQETANSLTVITEETPPGNSFLGAVPGPDIQPSGEDS